MARRVVLDDVQVATIGGCSNQGCVTLVAVASAVAAATAIVSSTVYIVGNLAYSIDRQMRCEPPRPQPEIDALAPPPG